MYSSRPPAVCGRQHRLQEPEEKRPRLLKVLQATPGEAEVGATRRLANNVERFFPMCFEVLLPLSLSLTPLNVQRSTLEL